MSDFRLKVFYSVAQNLSYTKASQELYISQPAVSKHIKELETKYKVRLFERLGGKIMLTPEGELLLKHAEKILQAYKDLEYEMNLLNNNYVGELHIGASTTISQYVLPPLLSFFLNKFPLLKLSLMNGNSREVEQALMEHRIDIGMVEGNVRQPSLHYKPFLKDELVAVTSADSKIAKHDEISLDDLLKTPLVLRELGSGTLDVFETALHQHKIKLSQLNIKLHLGSTESIKLFLENCDCMAITSIRSVLREIYSGMLKVIDIKGLNMTRDFSFVLPQGEPSNLVKLFIDYAFHNNKKL
jgi:Transcriptional regulator